MKMEIPGRQEFHERAAPFVVGLGGTLRSGSTSERALRSVLESAARLGARTKVFVGSDLALPLYNPESSDRSDPAKKLVSALRTADAIVISTPGYHGSISGLVKNAIDYAEDLKHDERVYFSHRPVGCIVAAAGWQSVGSTLSAMRSIVHALRGWPTPFGIGINSRESVVKPNDQMFEIMAKELIEFRQVGLARKADLHGSNSVDADLISASGR